MVNISLDELIELARATEKNDPLDWGEFLVDENVVFKTFGLSVYKAYAKLEPSQKDLVMLASLINLNVKLFLASLHSKELLGTIDKLQKELK